MDILSSLLNLIAPRRESAALLDTVDVTHVTSLLRAQQTSEVISLLPYQHHVVQALITENKFHRSLPARTLLATILTSWLEANYPSSTIWLVPIPLSPRREADRGYNQVTAILDLTSATYPAWLVRPLLTRTRDTVPQTTLGRTARLHNMKGAFALSSAGTAWLTTPPDIIIIVDDVLTTGATLAAARAALAPHLPTSSKLYAVALAH